MFKQLASAMPLPLLSLVGWSIIPDFATKHLLSALHRLSVIPAPNNPVTYRKQYALVFALVVLSYLSYNLLESARSMPPNFYQILSVETTVDEQGLKAAFRQFAKRNHPDKPDVGKEGEQLFIMVRDVYEALKNPVVRFAYDRFGPDVLSWSNSCTTTHEYIKRGLLHSSGYHIVVGAALVFWSFVGSSASNPVSFWRYLLYATLFTAEISLILSPSPHPPSNPPRILPGLSATYTTHTLLHTVFPQRLVHQHILFLHQLFVFLSFALSRVVPVLISAFSSPSLSAAQTQELSKAIAQLASVSSREASFVLNNILHSIASPSSITDSPPSFPAPPHEDISSLARQRPFRPPPGILGFISNSTAIPITPEEKNSDNSNSIHPLLQLKSEVVDLIIETNLKKEDGPLRSAWEAAVRRGRDRAASGPLSHEEEMNKVEKPKKNFWEASEDYDITDGDESSTQFEQEREIVIPELPTALPASPRRNDGASDH